MDNSFVHGCLPIVDFLCVRHSHVYTTRLTKSHYSPQVDRQVLIVNYYNNIFSCKNHNKYRFTSSEKKSLSVNIYNKVENEQELQTQNRSLNNHCLVHCNRSFGAVLAHSSTAPTCSPGLHPLIAKLLINTII